MPGLRTRFRLLAVAASLILLGACAAPNADLEPAPLTVEGPDDYHYIIGPGDAVSIFVWRNEELSSIVPVRPDGMITTPLIEDVVAAGKTPTELARDVEGELAMYLQNPVVTVIVTGFIGPFGQQVRVVGQAALPQALQYSDEMTLLDVMIQVGGLTEFASGNRTIIIRRENGNVKQYAARLDDLINDGDISANAFVLPGDIIIIPEAWF